MLHDGSRALPTEGRRQINCLLFADRFKFRCCSNSLGDGVPKKSAGRLPNTDAIKDIILVGQNDVSTQESTLLTQHDRDPKHTCHKENERV